MNDRRSARQGLNGSRPTPPQPPEIPMIAQPPQSLALRVRASGRQDKPLVLEFTHAVAWVLLGPEEAQTLGQNLIDAAAEMRGVILAQIAQQMREQGVVLTSDEPPVPTEAPPD